MATLPEIVHSKGTTSRHKLIVLFTYRHASFLEIRIKLEGDVLHECIPGSSGMWYCSETAVLSTTGSWISSLTSPASLRLVDWCSDR
jgi:hypothetical protein